MAITFPTDPGAQSPVNTFSPSSTPVANSANGNTYVWNGTAWTTQQANLEQYVNVAGDTMTGTLTVPTVDATTVDATTLNAGNIVLPDNGGITFGTSYTSGNGASGESKFLDDYEEGDWTPTFSNFDTWTNPTFNARYTKIGRVVHFVLRQTGGTVGWTTNQNIAGLPYVPREAGCCYATDTGPNEDNGVVLIWTNSNIYFNGSNGAEGSLVVSGTYITDA